MKTLLIVEDEKLIRQGIKTMVQRSGVPVEVIIECNNGEMALEVLREQKVDVMFTDIRMPKMDGIELVKRMQECEHVPLTVAISGYDDFSYAVEMLRKGVREYILKPVEREKITEVLKRLNDELENSKEKGMTNLQIGYQQMKHLMLDDHISEEEIINTEKQYEALFFAGEYRVCCRNARVGERSGTDNYILLEDMEGNDIYVVSEENVTYLLKNELESGYIGISNKYQGLRGLREAYKEALQMRRAAYLSNTNIRYFEVVDSNIPPALAQEAERLASAETNLQRVQQIGNEQLPDALKSLKQLFEVCRKGRVEADVFRNCMVDFLEQTEQTYKSIMPSFERRASTLKQVWVEECLDAYEEKMLLFVNQLHEKIIQQSDSGKNIQKMKKAIEYIQEHYADDLNMAVVSNHISMNYTLFSYSFKQYTGSNFVNYLKDIRMEEAKKLLAETDMKIIEISQSVGYDNEKHFMKIFKSTCGVSPTKYRKNMSHQ